MKSLSYIFVICVISLFIIGTSNAWAYCTASGGCDEYIYGVTFGSIDTWATPCNSYIDYSGSQSTSLQPGQSYDFEVITATPQDGPYHCYNGDQLGIWIDYNGDGDFTDLNEFVFSASYPEVFWGTITVPADARGGVTKMRVRLTWNIALNPCGSNTYGEVEDYGIVLPSPGPNTRIHGKKWNDLDDDTLMDAGEPGLAGWTIFLDEDRDGQIDPNDIVTTTDSQGNYEFTGMEPNEYYYVSEMNQPGWINTYPGAGGMHYRIMIRDGNDIELNFGNYQLHNCNISGYKFNDVNNNGRWDAGETPLNDWEIYLDRNENSQWDSSEPKTTTNASGFYEFTNLEPGYYNILEVPKAGWFQTYPGLTSGRLWGLEGQTDGQTMFAEVNLVTMTIENRIPAPYESFIIGVGCLAAGPSTLFYFPLKYTSAATIASLFCEIDPATGLVLHEGVLDFPQNEIAWVGAWHNGILYIVSVVIPLGNPTVAYLNRYDAISMKLISRDPLINGSGDGLAADPYENKLLSNLAIKWTVYEIDPNAASVYRTILQELPIRSSIAYTQGVLYKTHFGFEQMTVTNRYDGNLLSTPTLIGYKRFDALAGGIGTRGGHRVWIGKKNIQANFGARADSDGVLSGSYYNDLDGNGEHDANEPNIPGRAIYIDLDGDTHQDNNEPTTVTDANGNWSIGGLSYGRYFVRQAGIKPYLFSEPGPVWADDINVYQPRDIVFDDLRDLLYISTKTGKIEIYDLRTNTCLSPVIVGGSPAGMDITADYSALYVADTQLSSGSGVVHKVNLNTLSVTNLTYTVTASEEGSYDIAIGSQGIGLVTASYSGSSSVPLHILNTSDDTITVEPNVLGSSTINDDARLIRSFDRSKIFLVGNYSNGWVAIYDALSDTFLKSKLFNESLSQSPVALNHDGSLAAVQLTGHCRIVNSDFNMVMGLDDSKAGAVFDPSGRVFYQFNYAEAGISVIDTVLWKKLGHVSLGTANTLYQQFTTGETSITSDGRVFAITGPNDVILYRREYSTLSLPGRDIGGLDFGYKESLGGDIDKDGDVDIFDLSLLCQDWLCYDVNADIAPLIRDYFVNLPDLARFASAWQSRKGEQNWDALCDIEPAGGDGFVDIDDLKSLTDNWLMYGMIHDSDIAGIGGPDGYVNMIDMASLAKNWGVAENIIKYDEDFETGDFSKLPWVHSGDGPWTIDSVYKFEGGYSAKSGSVTRYADTILSVTMTCGEGNILFMLKTIGDGHLTFWIDDDLPYDHDGYWDGDLEWALVAVPVTAGTHTFKWSYSPNTYGDVRVWIDAIRFPPEE